MSEYTGVEHESGNHPPLPHSFILYKLSHNLIFMQVLFFKKLGQFKSIFISDNYFLLAMDWSFHHIFGSLDEEE